MSPISDCYRYEFCPRCGTVYDRRQRMRIVPEPEVTALEAVGAVVICGDACEGCWTREERKRAVDAYDDVGEEPSAEEAKRQGWDQGEVPGYWYGTSATMARRAGLPCSLGDACTTDYPCDFHAGKPLAGDVVAPQSACDPRGDFSAELWGAP